MSRGHATGGSTNFGTPARRATLAVLMGRVGTKDTVRPNFD
jgi:hypothetical protein